MQNSYRRANCIQILLQLFPLRLLCKVYREKELNTDDLFNLSEKNDTYHLVSKLSRHWQQELVKKRPSLLRALCRSFGWAFALNCLLLTMWASMPALYTYLIKLYLESLPIGDSSRSGKSLILLISIILACFLAAILRSTVFQRTALLGLLLRKSLTAILYRKVLRLPVSRVASVTQGKLITLASGDMVLIEQGAWGLPYVISAPLATILQLVVLYHIIGETTYYCVIILLVIFFLQFPLSSIVVNTRLAIGEATDRRLSLVKKLILGMHTIKSYVWEEAIISHIKNSRRVECFRFLKVYFWKGFSEGISRNSNILLGFPVVLVPLAHGQPLVASAIFTVLSLLDNIAVNGVKNFNFGMNTVADYFSVIKRTQQVLLIEENKDKAISQDFQTPNRIEAELLSTSWVRPKRPALKRKGSKTPKKLEAQGAHLSEEQEQKEDQKKCVNTDINLTLEDGKLLAVVGKVGSGKSSLLASLLGETHIRRGTLHRRGQMAYVEQEPSIFSDTVLNNILFGLPLDHERLSQVVRVCQLQKDLTYFPNGLETVIGERGINISGGQKARIALARACYSNAEIYLLDDPLSAVDPHVARKLFSQCIRGFLQRKAVLLVTHQVSFLEKVDEIMVLERGRTVFRGNYEQFMMTKQVKRLKIQEIKKEQEDLDQDDEESEDEISSTKEELLAKPIKKTNLNLIMEEEKNSRDISLRAYFNYVSQSPGCCFNVGLLLVAITPFILLGYLRFFISEWSSLPLSQQQQTGRRVIFIVISVVAIGISGAMAFLIVAIFVHLSNTLHNSMLRRVAHAPMRFFNSNPLGRIINRFSKDTAMADSVVTFQAVQWLQIFYSCLIYTVLSLAVFPYLLVVLLVAIVLIFLVLKFTDHISIEALRQDAISRSPINSLFSITLQNLITIRAYHRETTMTTQFENLVDQNGRAYFTYLAVSRWIGLQIELIGAFWILGTIIVSYFSTAPDAAAASDQALAITSSLIFLGTFQYLFKLFSDIQSSMNSIQRMQNFSKIEQERDAVLPSDKNLPPDWPLHGSIRFQDATLRYREDLEPVLRHINFAVEPGMKVGVVGRTGAGKSSLLQALFRLVECDRESSIFIDETSTSEIGLSTLRKVISIIPQSPFIFQGTVRENLDPFLQYSDQQLWDALEDVQLKAVVEQFDSGLEQSIEEGGTVFSVGQKQLICLARAILANNKILVLDQATANVDMDTDELIQETIKRKFKNSTVLTLAHRLDTIIKYDRVLVLSHGRIKQFGHPQDLLQNEEGHFAKMVEATGKQRSEILRESFNDLSVKK